jgi:hypothetical protein
MKGKVEKLIAEWEDVTVGTVQTTVFRTAAVISEFPDVPETVHEALGRLADARSEAEKLSQIAYIRDQLLDGERLPEEAKSILAGMDVQQKQKEMSTTRAKDIFVVVQYLRSLL